MSTRSVPLSSSKPTSGRQVLTPEPPLGASLDRLISLLETGSTPAVKQTAARQLGQVAGRSFGSAASAASASASLSDAPLGLGLESDAEWTEVLGLIGRVLPHLRSKSYDTRSAAALALEQIARAVPLWSPPAAPPGGPTAAAASAEVDSMKLAALGQVDLRALLAPDRPKLLASSGKEYALAPGGAQHAGSGPLSAAELKQSKDEVMRRMGIALPGGLDDGLGAFVDDEMAAEDAGAGPSTTTSPTAGGGGGLTTPLDGASPTLPPTTAPASAPAPPPTAVAPPRGKRQREQFEREEERRQREAEDEAFRGLSARQINALKRKRKASGGAAVVPSSATTSSGAGSGKAPRLDSPLSAAPSPAPSPVGSPRAGSSTLSAAVIVDPQAKAAAAAAAAAAAGGAVDPMTGKPDWTANIVVPRSASGAERWPFERVIDQLLVGLFAPAWEVRHGAALGLRELIKLHGASAGRTVGDAPQANDQANAERLLGLAHAVLTLLALDRFGDFNADQLVAPVRETAGQALASVLVHLPARHVTEVHAVLVGMVRQDWLQAGSASAMSAAGGRARGYAWEVRHAGLLGLKYEVAVRADLFDADVVKTETAVNGATVSPVKAEAPAAGSIAVDVKREEQFDEKLPQPVASTAAAAVVVKHETDEAPGTAEESEQSIDLLRDVVDAAVLG